MMPKQTDVDELEFIQTDIRMMRLLFNLLELKEEHCAYCDEIVTPETCGGIMPNFKESSLDKPVILCRSIMCMLEYFDDHGKKERGNNDS